ncbi:dTMP kinase [Pseudomonas sp. QTF5]|uniref:dTMP kinase n=1 Tax=Pseudomonas sp. QTF5 TaxID=1435425 RepID=UPI0021143CD3|nr:dTMP kinase [Pseudomonas sp. QTF5]
MNRPLFVSLDGPKGTGKTTLLEAVTKVLRADNKKVIRLCEKKSDPYRGETMALVNKLVRNPTRDLELGVCERFADSRTWISQHVLAKQPPGSIILIDRWYPSDAAFRRLVPFAEILQLNIDRNVRVPDLHVGVVTAPDISWARAAARGRGLGSTVIHKLEEHVACTQAFERAIADHGWVLCRNEGTIEDATMQVISEIYRVLRCPVGEVRCAGLDADSRRYRSLAGSKG